MADVTAQELKLAVLNGNKVFRGFDLSGLNLEGAGWMIGCIFEMANFTGANLAGARLDASSLWMANFTGANLAGASLRATKLDSKTIFTGANLTDADFSHSEGAREAVYDEGVTPGGMRLQD